MIRSITTKIWGATIILVFVVLIVSGTVHSRIISNSYLNQEKSELRSKTMYFAGLVNEGQELSRLAETADALGINVMVIGRSGELRQCVGMGMTQEMTPAVGHHPVVSVPNIENAGNGGYFYTGQNQVVGGKVLAMVYPLQDGGRLVVSTPFSPIEQTLARMHVTSLYTGLGGLLLTGLLGLVLSRTLSKPLREMTAAAGAMAKGDFSRRVTGGSSTEVNALAESLNTLAAELESRIAEINRLDQTRRDFVANVAHEIRTPLAIIQASAEALEDGVPSTEEERAAYLQNITGEIRRLRSLTNDLLDLRSLESGSVDLHLEDVQIASLIEDTIARLRLAIEEKEIDISVGYSDELPLVYTDRERLEQVLINLLANAARYTPRGGRIRVGAESDGKTVRIGVEDNGPGIDPEDVPFVFERFYKADRSRTRSQGAGTGLGLAIVKSITENLGGKVSVTSTPGHGARFTVELPLGDR
ncbi:MAG: HAMP domain-containing sensor histidine kinase [Bacillota bacterium]